MELTDLLASTKKISVPFPGKPGFVVDINYVSKEELKKIAEKSKTITFDNKTHQPVEGLDDEIWTKEYVGASITGWKGLKYEYLKDLALVKEESLPKEGELAYSLNNAIQLVNSSKSFDNWVSSVMSDISLFNKGS